MLKPSIALSLSTSHLLGPRTRSHASSLHVIGEETEMGDLEGLDRNFALRRVEAADRPLDRERVAQLPCEHHRVLGVAQLDLDVADRELGRDLIEPLLHLTR